MGLQELWFIIIAFLFLGYFVLEGFDFGVGMLLPILGRKSKPDGEARRRVVLNTIGPVWDGNEVWLITAGGALFAAFPEWYATLFSGFYFPLLLILVALILRICAIEWRGKIDDDTWRQRADIGIAIGSWAPAILWGVAFANIVQGVAIDADRQVTTSLWGLLNPYALLGGLTFLLIFLLHGAVFLGLKTAGEVRVDALAWSRRLAIPTVVVAAVFALWTQLAHGSGWTWAAVVVAAVSLISVVWFTIRDSEGWAFVFTTVAIIAAGVLLFGSLFPDVMPSTTNPEYSLTIHNTSSSHYTLVVMTWAAVFITPIVLLYQGWTYWVFRQRISAEQIPPSVGLQMRNS
ncbi:cytochrome d ubiquinol oxidase subunit II [Rhodococcus rhodnii]|uniref:Cytochrome bd ubiquinol oxidase subunit II n=2 Tax=Rhodococcus rhodnii TaxID=38312 RepID=R7WH41_9NOCA|nr:cytochrome d ubiquinol oxidase subunit II [Rhodococcus rhodnii]EOM74391.1 cytochrome bd ubiquinol oxidase subunit II [Rhodococcus rhodnii LMG 5362]TXG89108.1 cytochrome d ubiquinol oxidase subunit II [Rhodococcus rhodnii]